MLFFAVFSLQVNTKRKSDHTNTHIQTQAQALGQNETTAISRWSGRSFSLTKSHNSCKVLLKTSRNEKKDRIRSNGISLLQANRLGLRPLQHVPRQRRGRRRRGKVKIWTAVFAASDWVHQSRRFRYQSEQQEHRSDLMIGTEESGERKENE